jgi:hypothetical protein
LYRRTTQIIDGIEVRHVAPAAARVNAILDDVKGVTATVKTEVGRVDRAAQWIIDLLRRRLERDNGEPSLPGP